MLVYRTTLNTLEVQREPKRYREAVQKVIHYMTLGMLLQPYNLATGVACWIFLKIF